MPLYQCISPEGFLSEEQQKSLARKITKLHCEMTGAPKMFVHVMFSTIKAGTCYSGGEHSQVSFLRASWRAGRDVPKKQQALHALAELWANETGRDIRKVLVSISELPASSIMEFGLILPEPEQEQEWYVRHGFAEAGTEMVK
jgi:phenylpyruvate tautomerase PptA (4-oxalocrotonate tautomerase family)